MALLMVVPTLEPDETACAPREALLLSVRACLALHLVVKHLTRRLLPVAQDCAAGKLSCKHAETVLQMPGNDGQMRMERKV